MPYIYILKLRDGTHYCGIAKNVVRRLIDHGKGRSKSTREKRPHVIKFVREVETMQEARNIEVRVKKQGVTRWCIKYANQENNISQMVTDDIQAEYLTRKITQYQKGAKG